MMSEDIDYKAKYEECKKDFNDLLQKHNALMDLLQSAGLQLQVLAVNNKFGVKG